VNEKALALLGLSRQKQTNVLPERILNSPWEAAFVSPMIVCLKTSCLPHKDIPVSLIDEELKSGSKRRKQ